MQVIDHQPHAWFLLEDDSGLPVFGAIAWGCLRAAVTGRLKAASG